MNEQFEDFKKEYIGTTAPAKNWEEIAGKLGQQSRFSTSAIVKSTLAVSAILILAAAFLYTSPKSPQNQQSAVKNNGQGISTPQEATPSVSPVQDLNLEQPQQAPEQEPQDEQDQNPKKGRFWDFFYKFYKKESGNNLGEIEGVKDKNDEDSGNDSRWNFSPRYRYHNR